MDPTTVIGLFFITGCIIGVSLFAFLLPKKIRKIVWVILGIVLISSYIFLGAIRPFIIQQQTNQAIEELEKHLEVSYPEDSWSITDTDENQIKSVIYLHVIFESEPKVVYEYAVEEAVIEQVSMWTVLGNSVEESGIKPQHKERE
jgi:hypothetical protein